MLIPIIIKSDGGKYKQKKGSPIRRAFFLFRNTYGYYLLFDFLCEKLIVRTELFPL